MALRLITGKVHKNATSMFKPKSRASGGHRRDSGGPSRCRTATLAHVPNYVARRHATLAAKNCKTQNKRDGYGAIGRGDADSASAFAVQNAKGRTKAARFWCGPGWRYSKASGEASALGSQEVLPAERADFLKPAVTQLSPPQRQGCRGRAAGRAAAAPRAARGKGEVRRPRVPHPFPNGKGEE